MKKWIKRADVCLAFVMAVIFTFLAVGDFILPAKINRIEMGKLTFSNIYSVDLTEKGTAADVAVNQAGSVTHQAEIKLFGMIPVKETAVSSSQRQYVVPGGQSFGIKLYTDGVIVVGITNVDSESGVTSPAKDAGLHVGDIIVSIEGQKVNTTEEVQAFFNNSQGKALKLKVKREEQYLTIIFSLAYSPSVKGYKAGMWIRDSTAGVGTITFYNPANNTFAGLGHAVNDVDTNEVMPLLTGEAVKAKVTGVYKGTAGETGSLSCSFVDEVIGNLKSNIKNGIYGNCVLPIQIDQQMPVAACQEVQKGEAQILSTIEGEEPKFYNINIERINYSNEQDQKNMVIKVTDPELLEKTGGIVQGMSGSPIIQNGMLVGAVTHVFVNNPTKGYAIFAENMLETSNTLK